MCRIHRSAVWIGFVLFVFSDVWGCSGLSTCNIACKRFPMHRYDESPIIKPLYVVIMCSISV